MVRFAILFSNIFNFTPTSLFPTLHDDSEATLKTSFDENDSSLDRIGTFTIPPPNTVASTEDCLVHVKGVSCHDVQLLENEEGEVAIAAGFSRPGPSRNGRSTYTTDTTSPIRSRARRITQNGPRGREAGYAGRCSHFGVDRVLVA